MFLCGGMTVLSLFMNVGPSFMTCGITTAVLGLCAVPPMKCSAKRRIVTSAPLSPVRP